MNDAQMKAWDRVLAPWWSKMLLGLFLVVAGISTYQRCNDIESGDRDSDTLFRAEKFLFWIGGKHLAGGLPIVSGAGCIAWGFVQLCRRTPLRTNAAPIGNRTNVSRQRPSATEPQHAFEPSYAGSLYLAFWKAIFAVFGFAHIVLALLLLRVIWNEPATYASILAVLLAVPVAYVELELIARLARWEHGPIFDWRNRGTILLAGGYALAIALTVTMLVAETGGRQRARAAADRRAAEREQTRQMMRGPNFQRANDVLRLRQEHGQQQQAAPER